MAFYDTQLPVDIERGARGGLNFYTTVIASPDGSSQRNQNWEDDLGEWDISYGIRKDSLIRPVRDFYYEMRGSAHSFRFKDWNDFKAELSLLAIGDGVTTAFQLVKVYGGALNPYVRQIFKPIAATVLAYKGVTLSAHTLGADGVISFAVAPLLGVEVRATFEFDVPVRFASDQLSQVLNSVLVSSIPAIKIVGVRAPYY